jgi:hypothetical protein
MSNRPKKFDQKSTAHYRNRSKAHLSTKTLLKWIAVFLAFLLVFWLVVAEDIGSWIGWGNP